MRTEQDVLKDFESLGWKVIENQKSILRLRKPYTEFTYVLIKIFKSTHSYQLKITYIDGLEYGTYSIDMDIHKLLNELFTIWEWI